MARNVLAVVGLQWGDEGKGKIVDWFCANGADVAVRFQGGNNAGHTIVVGGVRSVLHLVPSGVLHPHVTCLVGQGVVIDPWALLGELDELAKVGIDAAGRVRVSENCAMILPHHIAVDGAREKGTAGIGTTQRGIGPVHEDKTGRRAVRLRDLFNGRLEPKLARMADHHNQLLTGLHGLPGIDPGAVLDGLAGIRDRIEPLVGDVPGALEEAVSSGRNVLLEGAQGALLDFEHGTYPYVTSSSCLAGASAGGTGVGLSPRVVGVAKAYATRVGEGPFPTELRDDTGRMLLEWGNEYGATTGRTRRCGWLDIPALRYAMRLNGCRSLCVTKLDVLDRLDEIRLCVGYRVGGVPVDGFPVQALDSADAQPVYETVLGWGESTSGLGSFADMPGRMRDFVRRIERLSGGRVDMVSVGAERGQTLARGRAPFLSRATPVRG